MKPIWFFFFLLLMQIATANAQYSDAPGGVRIYNPEEADNVKKANIFFENSLAMLNAAGSAPSERRGLLLHQLGKLSDFMGRTSEAEDYFIASLDVFKKSTGTLTNNYLNVLNDFANFHLNQNKAQYAKPVGAEIIAQWKTMNEQHIPVTLSTLCYAGQIFARLKNYDVATDFAKAALANYHKSSQVADGFSTLRLGLLQWSLKGSDSVTNQLFRLAVQRFAKEMEICAAKKDYEALLNLKIDCSNAHNILLSLITDRDDEALLQTAMQAQLLFKGIKTQITIPDVGSTHQNSVNISYEQIVKNLGKGEIAIDFVSFNYWNQVPTGNVYYGAFLINPENSAAQFIKLFERRELEEVIYDGGQQLKSADILYRQPNQTTNFSKESIKLNALIWQKIKPYLGQVKKIYYCGDGSINYLNLAAIADARGYLGDRYIIQPLTNLRSLSALKQEKKTTLKTFNLVGGLRYTEFTDLEWSAYEINELSKMIGKSGKKISSKLTENKASLKAFDNLQKLQSDVLFKTGTAFQC